MEASAAPSAHDAATGSRTIADLLSLAARKHGAKTAVRFKRDDQWHDVSFHEVGEIVSRVARGLIAVGIEKGDRVCILSSTRPEWSYADFGISSAGGVVVPIYPTNSAEECEWVAGNSEARAVIAENAEQVAKILEVRHTLPRLETIVVMDPAGDVGPAISLDDLCRRGDAIDPAQLAACTAEITRDDPFTFIYTSGTTGPPKGCVLSHGNYRDVLDMCERLDVIAEGETVYLFLPLAHAFALLIQLISFDVGSTIAYFGGDPKQIVPELQETRPTYLPSVPRIFEKIYTLVAANIPEEDRRKATALGVRVRDLRNAGRPVPDELQQAFDAADEKLYKNVRAIFGGNLRQAVTGAAPIAKEILEFFYACGVPVLEGYGMTETATVHTYSTIEHHRFGTVGRALPGTEIKIAEDGEILLKGPNIFQGYYKNDDASFGAVIDGWLHTGDLGSLDEEGFLSITGRKKDIIITAGGKNLTPANFENQMKQTRWVSQCVMHGDRRPYPTALITLDEEEIVPWAKEQGIEDTSIGALAKDARVHALVQAEVDRVNESFAQVEQVKRFVILDHDLSIETGEMTPSLKVKRNVVNDKYGPLFDELYG
ncbi:MAG TPA: long-chain fatty acid--CoA ligase [Solirubrobacteraceae bacterium]|nr:long-chain fatty acid--CoA ligase [Solirubrobacteraceae bacterium]